LVFAFDDRKGQPNTPEDIPLDERPAFAYPMDPITEVVRSRFRLNQVLLVRLKPEGLSERTREYALQGLVCYSAVCTHTGCDVSEWIGPTQNLVCPCHASFFNPKDRGRVVAGPARKPLATLPLAVVDGVLTVKAPFIGRVGFKKEKK
jgi:Rieske Fe-S protein